jgi:hypothetical protein
MIKLKCQIKPKTQMTKALWKGTVLAFKRDKNRDHVISRDMAVVG